MSGYCTQDLKNITGCLHYLEESLQLFHQCNAADMKVHGLTNIANVHSSDCNPPATVGVVSLSLLSPITFKHGMIMKNPIGKLTLALCACAFCLTVLPSSGYSQTTITELGLQNLLDVTLDVTITYDDNSTETVSLNSTSDVIVIAPAGKSMSKVKAGTKTVSLPMDPSPQTGWSIPGTLPGAIVVATTIENDRSFGDWRSNFYVGSSTALSFSY